MLDFLKNFYTLTTGTKIGVHYTQTVFVDRNGTIFVGTDMGLSISSDNGNTFINKTTSDGLTHNSITSIYADSNGWILAAGVDGPWTPFSLSKNGGNSFLEYSYQPNEDIGAYSIMDYFINTAGVIYFATDDGLIISEDECLSFIQRIPYHGVGSNNVYSVIVDNYNTIYVGTEEGLSISSDGGNSFINKTISDGLGGDYVGDLFLDDNGTLYACNNNSVSISFDGGDSFINKDNGEKLDSCRDIYVEEDGTIYVGAGGQFGILMNNVDSFIVLGWENGLTFDSGHSVHTMAIDVNNIYYTSTNGLGVIPKTALFEFIEEYTSN
jgi:ligand-binding sensor domain-containing protein